MSRMMLSDAQWDRIEPLLPGKAGDPGRSGTDNRLFLEAVLWLRCAVAGPARGIWGAWQTVGVGIWWRVSAKDRLALQEKQPLGRACVLRSSSGSLVMTTA